MYQGTDFLESLPGLIAFASSASSCAYRELVVLVAPLLLLQGSLHNAASAASTDPWEGGEWREESVRRSVDAMLVCIHARSLVRAAVADSVEVQTLVRFCGAVRSQGGAMVMVLQSMALGASGPLFNYAVAAYNATNFAQAVGPLSMACYVCTLLTDVGSLAAPDVAQMAKRQRMFAYCLQRTGALLPALESSARAAVLLALGADWKASTAAIQECVSLRSSLLASAATTAEGDGLRGHNGTASDKCRLSVRSTLLELSGYAKELAAAGSVPRFLEAELWGQRVSGAGRGEGACCWRRPSSCARAKSRRLLLLLLALARRTPKARARAEWARGKRRLKARARERVPLPRHPRQLRIKWMPWRRRRSRWVRCSRQWRRGTA